MFLAKSNPQETIRSHTDCLLKEYELLKKHYEKFLPQMNERLWELLKIAVTYHDVGKANTVFQSKINPQISVTNYPNIPHNYLSALLVPYREFQVKRKERRLLVHAIGYHHEREQEPNKNDIQQLLEEDGPKWLDELEDHMNFEIEKKFSYAIVDSLLTKNRYRITEEDFFTYVLLKGLLHRIDHSASAYIDIETDCEQSVGKFTNTYIKNAPFDKNNLQIFSEKHQDKNLIITAQTGMGKTEAALLWINDSKAFFTLPLRVSINAIFDRIKKDINFEGVGLLHSSSIDYLTEQGVENWEALADQSKQLSSKLLMTTIDQILKFPFYYRGFEKELATMAYSKVVIDEIQAYDPKIAAMLIKALELIHKVGGKFMVMTATLPTIYIDEMKKRGLLDPKVTEVKEFTDDTKLRHCFSIRDEKINDAIDEIIEKSKDKQVLVIVNTVKKAVELFNQMGSENTYLLHSQFLLEDRQKIEQKIKAFNKEKTPGIWITTQLVEASIDIDFDYLFTESSTLDSLFQRFGRCYRKQELKGKKENIYIFTKESSGIPYIYDEQLVSKSIELLIPLQHERLKESDKIRLVQELYHKNNLKGTKFYEEFQLALRQFDAPAPYELSSKQAQELLRDIHTVQVIPRKIYDDIEEWFEEYKMAKGKEKLEKKRKIERKTASVYKHRATKKGLSTINGNRYRGLEHIYIIEAEYDFNEETLIGEGIQWDKEFSSIIG